MIDKDPLPPDWSVRFFLAFPKAFVGAFAGLMASAILVIASTEVLGFRTFDPDLPTGGRACVILVVVVVSTMAILVVIAGAKELGGRSWAAIRRVAWGMIIGMAPVAIVGLGSGSAGGKGGPADGVFLFGILAAVVGGVIGFGLGDRRGKLPVEDDEYFAGSGGRRIGP